MLAQSAANTWVYQRLGLPMLFAYRHYVIQVTDALDTANGPIRVNWQLDEQRSRHVLRHTVDRDTLLTEQAEAQRLARLAAARAHAGASDGLDLVHVAIAGTDQLPNLSGSDALATADDVAVTDRLDRFGQRTADPRLLDANACDALSGFCRCTHLDENGAIVGGNRFDFFDSDHKDAGAIYQTNQDNEYALALAATNFNTVFALRSNLESYLKFYYI